MNTKVTISKTTREDVYLTKEQVNSLVIDKLLSMFQLNTGAYLGKEEGVPHYNSEGKLVIEREYRTSHCYYETVEIGKWTTLNDAILEVIKHLK
jgi:hypothetical protein